MKKAYLKYLLSVLLFGMNGIVASHIALNSVEIVFLRTLIGSALLVVLFLVTSQKRRFFKNKKDSLFLLISGAAMGASWMFLYTGYQAVGVGISTLLYYSGPVIMMILSPLLFREKLTWPKVTGFLTVAAGIFCLNAQVKIQGKIAWGLLCGFLSAGTYVIMVIFNKKNKTIVGVENAMWQLLAGFITVAIWMGARQGLLFSIGPDSWLPILLLGLVNTGVGCYLYFSSIGSLPVQTVALCGYLEPLSAVIFSAALLGERMTTVQMVGACLILGGAAFGEAFRVQSKKQRVPTRE